MFNLSIKKSILISVLLSLSFLSILLITLQVQNEIKRQNQNIRFLVNEEIGLIVNSLDSYRVLQQIEFINKTIFKLSQVEAVALYDKNCDFLISQPINSHLKCSLGTTDDNVVQYTSSNTWADSSGAPKYIFVRLKNNLNIYDYIFNSNLIIFIFSIFFTFLTLILLFNKFLISPLEHLNSILSTGDKESLNNIRSKSIPLELLPIYQSISQRDAKIEQANQEIITFQREKARIDINRQVAHDIRSPLTALNILLEDLDNPSEVIGNSSIFKSAISRIQSIADDLLKTSDNHFFKKSSDQSIIEINSLIQSLVKEKLTEYKAINDLKITFIPNESSILSIIGESDLKRILSNLINNSVEASGVQDCIIEITTRLISNKVQINIKDNGLGMDELNLSKLNMNNFFTTKFGNTNSGNALGVKYAKQTLQKINGDLIYTKNNGGGVIATITIPSLEFQNRIANFLELPKFDKEILIIDDDESIFKLWEDRLNSSNTKNILKYINSPEEFNDLYPYLNMEKVGLILCDNRFTNSNLTGLDFLEKIKFSVPTFLVTTQIDSKHILERAEKLNIKIIPKSDIPKIQIKESINKLQKKTDAILIDDDVNLIHPIWKMQANRFDKSLVCFNSFDSFLAIYKEFDFDTPIYIDRHLGVNNKFGEFAAENLNQIGFTNIIMATGDPYGLDHLDFLKGVVGKEPPW